MKASWIVLVSLGLLTGGERPGPTSLEAQGAKITVSTKRVGKFDTGCAAFLCRLYLRIENTTSNPLDPGLGGSYLQREDGKALRALTAEEATEAMGYGMTHGKLGALVGATTGMHEPRQAGRAYGPAIVQQWFVFGPIPPNSYREGIVYFEGSGKARPKGLLLRLPGLLQEGLPVAW